MGLLRQLIINAWEDGNTRSHECNTRFDDENNLNNFLSNYEEEIASFESMPSNNGSIELTTTPDHAKQLTERADQLGITLNELLYQAALMMLNVSGKLKRLPTADEVNGFIWRVK